MIGEQGMSLILKPDSVRPDDAALRLAAGFITSGKTVIFPTETFYALGVSAYDEQAIKKVFTVKVREQGNPLPVIVAGETMLEEVVSEVPARAASLIGAFWPGGLTLILRASTRMPELLISPAGTLAVRVSSHPLAQLLVAGAGVPITATSANLSGKGGCSTAPEVEKQLGASIDLIIDGGTTEGLLPSTIVDLTLPRPRIVREGIISAERLRPFLD